MSYLLFLDLYNLLILLENKYNKCKINNFSKNVFFSTSWISIWWLLIIHSTMAKLLRTVSTYTSILSRIIMIPIKGCYWSLVLIRMEMIISIFVWNRPIFRRNWRFAITTVETTTTRTWVIVCSFSSYITRSIYYSRSWSLFPIVRDTKTSRLIFWKCAYFQRVNWVFSPTIYHILMSSLFWSS